MNKKNHLLLVAFFLNISIGLVTGQNDSIKNSDTLDLLNSYELNQKRKQKYLDVNLRKETTLFKIHISPIKFQSVNNFSIGSFSGGVAIEQKLSPAFSFIVNNNSTYHASSAEYLSWENSTDFGLRVYYSINKRIKESVGANNFHSNYISVNLVECIKYRDLNWDYLPSHFEEDIDNWTYRPLWNFSWGMQRRIGKWLFVDAGPYLEFSNGLSGLGLNLLFGLGIGK